MAQDNPDWVGSPTRAALSNQLKSVCSWAFSYWIVLLMILWSSLVPLAEILPIITSGKTSLPST